MLVKGLLQSQRLGTVGQALGKVRADIEDLFTPDEYVTLYNKAFGTAVKVPDLPPGDGPIVKRLEERVGAFDHGRPAEVMLRDPDFVKTSSEATLKGFEKLFELVNATIPNPTAVRSGVAPDTRSASEPAAVAE